LRRNVENELEALHSRVDAEWSAALEALEAELTALGIKVADPAPVESHKRRWFW
jgi:hypothetical protein